MLETIGSVIFVVGATGFMAWLIVTGWREDRK